MKILLISNYYYPEHVGGVEIVSHNLVKHYRSYGNDVRWMAADVSPNFRDAGRGDIPVRSWNIAEARLGFPSPLPSPTVLGKLYNCLRWCDVVHLQDSLYPINILAFAMLKTINKPVLITQYAKQIPYKQLYKRMLQTVLYATIGKLMFRSANMLVFITANVREGMQNLAADRHFNVVPLGVDTDFFMPLADSERNTIRKQLGVDAGSPLLLFVGRMVERKGVGLVREIIERNPSCRWILVGRPDDYDPSKWDLPNLTYYSNVPEKILRHLYCAADLLVHPSQGEGLTLTASESMACGTPVIISRESIYELDAVDKDLFLPVSFDRKDLERAITDAFNRPEHLLELRDRVREYTVKQLSWRKVSEKYLAILAEIHAHTVASTMK